MCQWWGASRGLRASSTLWNLVLKLPGRPFQAVLCVSARKSALIDSSWLEFTLIFYFCLLVNCKELFKITCRCLSLHMGMCRYMQLSLEASALDPLGLVWWLWDAGSQTPVLEEQQASCPLNHLSSPKNSFSSSFFFLNIVSLLNKEAIFRHWLQGLHRLVTCVPMCIPIFLLCFYGCLLILKSFIYLDFWSLSSC